MTSDWRKNPCVELRIEPPTIEQAYRHILNEQLLAEFYAGLKRNMQQPSGVRRSAIYKGTK